MKLTIYNIFISALTLTLLACTVGPDYVPPKAPEVSQYTEEGNRKFTSSVPSKWWQSFQSTELNQVIELGTQNNYSLQAMQETLKQAQENVNATKGQLAPQVNANTSVGYEKYGVQATGDNDGIPAFHYYSLGPSINWALDLFGGMKRSIEQQQALAQYQQQEFNAAFLTLTGNIVTTSIRIAELNAQISHVQAIIHDDQKNLQLAKVGIEVGSATQEDKLQMQSQLSHDETLLAPLQQQLSTARGELNILVGKFPANWQSPHFELTQFTLPKNLPLTLPSQLVHDRPDILAAEALLHAANASVGIATANLYPQINLSANLAQEALSPGQLFNAASTTASIIGGITAPVFSGGTLKAQKNAAEHALKAAYANYQEVVIRAFVQVSDVLHALQYDEQNITAQKKALDSAEASLKLAQLGNQVGSSTKLELLNAQRSYHQAEFNYVQAMTQRYCDTAQLYLVLGGGVVS